MGDCRNARVRLRRRLEDKYLIKRVSVKSKQVTLKNDIGKDLDIVKIIPRVIVSIDLTNRKDDFIKNQYDKFKNTDSDLVLKVDYSENNCNNYRISFLIDNIDIGLEPIKNYGITEIMNNVIPELERIYKEVELEEI